MGGRGQDGDETEKQPIMMNWMANELSFGSAFN